MPKWAEGHPRGACTRCPFGEVAEAPWGWPREKAEDHRREEGPPAKQRREGLQPGGGRGRPGPRSPQSEAAAQPLPRTHRGGGRWGRTLRAGPVPEEPPKAPPRPRPAGGPHPRRRLPSPTRANAGGTGCSARAPSPAGGGDITATAGGAASRASLPRRLPPARTDGRTTGGRWTAARGPRTGARGRRERGVRGPRLPRPHGGPGASRRRRAARPGPAPLLQVGWAGGGDARGPGGGGRGRRRREWPARNKGGGGGGGRATWRGCPSQPAGGGGGTRGAEGGCRGQGAPGRRKGSPRVGALGLPLTTLWKPAREGRLGGG